jgi:hypothetical protein
LPVAAKAAQAKAEANIQKAVTDAANAFAQMKTAARAVGKKTPYGGLLRCTEEAKAANGIPASITINPHTVQSRVVRGNHTGQRFQSPLQPIDDDESPRFKSIMDDFRSRKRIDD